MKVEKTIDVLNALVQINNDRIKGYETASKETDEYDLNSLFASFCNTSNKINQELSDEINKLGGQPTDSTKVSGKFFRAWMDVKAALTGKDRKAILDSCEYGEDQALNTYQEVLKNDREHLTNAQQTMIQAQHALLKADHDKVKLMRDVHANAQA